MKPVKHHYSATYDVMKRTGLPERTVKRFLKDWAKRHYRREWFRLNPDEIEQAVSLLSLAKNGGSSSPLLYLKKREQQPSLFDFI